MNKKKPNTWLCSTAVIIHLTIVAVLAQPSNSQPIAAATNAAAVKFIGPRIAFDVPIFDFGRVCSGQIIKHTFTFTNTGDRMLVLSRVQPSCGCTTAGNWDQRVAPGKTGIIPIQFNTANYNGPFAKVISVTCTDPTHPTVPLQLKGTLWKPIDIIPQYIMFNQIAGNLTNETKIVRIINNETNALTLSMQPLTNRAFSAELKTIQTNRQYELHISMTPPAKDGPIQQRIILNTTSTNSPILTILANAFIQKPILVLPAQITLPPGPLTTDSVVNVTIRNLSSSPIALSDASVDQPEVGITLREVLAGRMFNLNASFPAGFQIQPGQKFELTLNSNHPQFPVIKVPVYQLPQPAFRQAAMPFNPPPALAKPSVPAREPVSQLFSPAIPQINTAAVLAPAGQSILPAPDPSGPPLPVEK